MLVRAIQWQTHGQDDTLDARLGSRRGLSKVHALRAPIEWDGLSWSTFARLPFVCGQRAPTDDDWMHVCTFPSVEAVTCRHCLDAIGPDLSVPWVEKPRVRNKRMKKRRRNLPYQRWGKNHIAMTREIRFRLPPKHYQAVALFAAARGYRSLSAYMRALILRDIDIAT